MITMLPDSPDVQAVLLGEDGVFASARPGTLVIDMSTIRPDVARAVAAAGASAACGSWTRRSSVARPGRRGHAVDHRPRQRGTLEAARPLFEVMGQTIAHVGPAGSGQTVKAANQ